MPLLVVFMAYVGAVAIYDLPSVLFCDWGDKTVGLA